MNDEERQRTLKQNSSIHKYCTMLANALNDAGFDQRVVLFGDLEDKIMRAVDTICPNDCRVFEKIFYDFQGR